MGWMLGPQAWLTRAVYCKRTAFLAIHFSKALGQGVEMEYRLRYIISLMIQTECSTNNWIYRYNTQDILCRRIKRLCRATLSKYSSYLSMSQQSQLNRSLRKASWTDSPELLLLFLALFCSYIDSSNMHFYTPISLINELEGMSCPMSLLSGCMRLLSGCFSGFSMLPPRNVTTKHIISRSNDPINPNY